MKMTRKLCIALLLTVVACTTLSACLSQASMDAQRANIDRLEKAAGEVERLKAVYDDLRDRYRAGDLELQDFVEQSSEVTSAINRAQSEVVAVKASIDAQRSSGASWWELLLTAGIAFFGRGLPSKGPLKILRKLTGGSVRKK